MALPHVPQPIRGGALGSLAMSSAVAACSPLLAGRLDAGSEDRSFTKLSAQTPLGETCRSPLPELKSQQQQQRPPSASLQRPRTLDLPGLSATVNQLPDGPAPLADTDG
ncbi:hypothetical protein BOX15_Mlig033646g3 [Macrostomum lignano]|uniref:Uncharacterized protein n=1 Tax=Macrostomum lignano TaxID=282301 RepID=A0A267EBI4_9PLAT|nr:hypothetical protein BOX15_Mlig033646g3 [Macrostomum lignano]